MGAVPDRGRITVFRRWIAPRQAYLLRRSTLAFRRYSIACRGRIPVQVDRAVQHHAGHADGHGQLLHHADRAAGYLPRHRRGPAAAGEHHAAALAADGLPGGHRGAGGQLRAAGRHVRPGADVQPGVRDLRAVLRRAVGDAMLMANSSAILTDAFPAGERGLALGLNQVAAIAGSFIGLVLGGILGPLSWRYVFLVSVPFGVAGTIWSYLKLRELGERHAAKLDWWGNITFATGLISVLVGITYGIQPY